MKIVDELNYRYYHNDNPKKLNLKNPNVNGRCKITAEDEYEI